jgi:threonine synthase
MGNDTQIRLRCVRCESEIDLQYQFLGCPLCESEVPVNLTLLNDYDRIGSQFKKSSLQTRPLSMWRYKEFMPLDDKNIISIGEGMTPLHRYRALGSQIGLENLYVKDETRNPTWSYKDRLASAGISMAVQSDANTVTVSSTGNHGAATAAYAAKAGLNCVVFTTTSPPPTMRTLMQVYGAKVVATPAPEDRWTLMDACVKQFGWIPMGNFHDPIIGSNPYGVEGYKSLAFEICEQLNWKAPDKVVMPVAHCDGFYGCWKGFKELFEIGLIERRPIMVAAEPYGPLKNALAKGIEIIETVPSHDTDCFSVAVDRTSYQGLRVLLESNGIAEVASDAEAQAMQLLSASMEGVYAEISSALALAVAKKLRDEEKIQPEEVVVAVLTSGGLKDPEATAELLPSVPLLEPSMSGLKEGLVAAYDFSIDE